MISSLCRYEIWGLKLSCPKICNTYIFMPWASHAVVNPKFPHELPWSMPLGPPSALLGSGGWQKKTSLLSALGDHWRHWPRNIEMTPNSSIYIIYFPLYFSVWGQTGKQAKLRTQILMLAIQFVHYNLALAKQIET